MTNPVRSAVAAVEFFDLADVVEQLFQVASPLATDLQCGLNIGTHAFAEGGKPSVRMLVGEIHLPLQDRDERPEQPSNNSRDGEDRLHPSCEAVVPIGEGNDGGQREQPDRQYHHGRAASAGQCRSNIVLHDGETDTAEAA